LSPKRAWLFGGLLASFGPVGCYDGEFLVGQPCDDGDDCGRRSFCDAGLCGGRIAERGPSVEVTRPTDLSVGGSSTLTTVVTYEGMVFADPADPPEKWPFAHASVQVRLDGEPLGHIVVGDGEDGNTNATSGQALGTFEVPDEVAGNVGFHRFETVALDLDGESWEGDNARDQTWMWVRNGEPRVAFGSPSDGARAPRTQPLTVVASVADFALTPPDPDASSSLEDTGQVAVFLHFDFPECLPDCSIDDAVARVGTGFGGGGHSRELAFELSTAALSPTKSEREQVTIVLALVDETGELVLDANDEPISERVDLRWE